MLNVKRMRPRLLVAHEIVELVPVLAWWLRFHPSHLWGLALCRGGARLYTTLENVSQGCADRMNRRQRAWQHFRTIYDDHHDDLDGGAIQATRPLALLPNRVLHDRLVLFAQQAREHNPQRMLGVAVEIGLRLINDALGTEFPAYRRFVEADRSDPALRMLPVAYQLLGFDFPSDDQWEAAELATRQSAFVRKDLSE